MGTSYPLGYSISWKGYSMESGMLVGVAANPAFAPLAGDSRFKRIVRSLEGIAR